MTVLPLALRSLWNRKLVMGLVALAIAFSMSLLLGVERIAAGARESFQNTIADTHLIVGARSGPVQLLLHSVFHIGTPTAAISWKSYQTFAKHPEFAWTIPVSFGAPIQGSPWSAPTRITSFIFATPTDESLHSPTARRLKRIWMPCSALT